MLMFRPLGVTIENVVVLRSQVLAQFEWAPKFLMTSTDAFSAGSSSSLQDLRNKLCSSFPLNAIERTNYTLKMRITISATCDQKTFQLNGLRRREG